MSAHHFASILLAVLVALSLVATGHAETPKQYLIEVKLTTTLPSGQEKILCCPRLLVLDGQEGEIHLGDKLLPPNGVEQESLLLGTSCKFKVFRKDGRLFLDATTSLASGKSDDDGVSVTTTGLHVVRAITPDKKITAPAIKDLRWELLVREWNPDKPLESGLIEISQKTPADVLAQPPIAAAAPSPKHVSNWKE